ncbi:MAG TPA: 16S rRNA (uracil(1498)-N(3))-methyltransferase, partial [Candidatus Megaira endosymbiont of Hartmannula sinica]|nr:16S rRNA (uracil(1498)-N(3))-methyltransferase [Candidatus Megaera endosymbiont of Hartmannula sinica]
MEYTKLHRIYYNDDIIINNIITFDKKLENYHYITNVLRIKPNESLRIFNENDGEFLLDPIKSTSHPNKTISDSIRMSKSDRDGLLFKIVKKLREPDNIKKSLSKDNPIFVKKRKILAISIIKQQNFNFIVKSAVAMGVDIIIPIISDNSQNTSQLNQEKLDKIIIEATKQSERMDIMHISRTLHTTS